MSGRHRIPLVRGGSGASRLAWRQFAADPWVSAGLAALIGLVALMLTAVPRGLVDVQSRQLTQELGGLSAAQRDLRGDWGRAVIFGSQEQVSEIYGPADEPGTPGSAPDLWEALGDGAERVRQDQPEPLRSAMGPAQLLARLNNPLVYEPPVESGYYEATISLAIDPDLTEHVDLVEGDWPELVVAEPVAGPREEDQEIEPVPVVLLQEAASELLLDVGDEFSTNLVLAGTYTPADPADPRWQHIDNGAMFGTLFDANQGQSGLATGFLSPENRGSTGQPTSVEMRLWYPVSTSSITGSTAQVEALNAQVNGFLTEQHTLASADQLVDARGPQNPLFSTGLTEALERVVSQQRASTSLLAVVAAGPLGVALAVCALGARLVVHRRRSALALTLARGAAPAQLRRLIAVEGLLLGLPAAALGHLVATLLVPGPTPWWQWVLTVVVALVPSAALAASIEDSSLLQRRSDLSGRSRSRWRWVAEVAVIGLAAVATWRLLDRGVQTQAQTGVDLLAAATPALLSLAACVVALRLYPLPLAALTDLLRRRPGLTPFLGSARALRDPPGGLVPALAVVLGTTIALVSALLLTTVTRGAYIAAWEENGAQVRLSGPVLTDQLREELASVADVAAVGGVVDHGFTEDLVVDGERSPVRVWIADPGVEQVYAAAPLVQGPPPQFYGDEGLPPVMTLRTANVPEGAQQVTVSRVGEVSVLGHLDELPGIRLPGAAVLVSAQAWEAAGGVVPSPTTTLIAVAEDGDPDVVADAVQALVGGGGVVTTAQTRLEAFEESPVTQGLRQLLVGATVVAALLTVLAVVVVQLIGSGARTRLLATLRTLGLAPRQTRALTAWELAPLLATSMAVGTALGLGVPWILLRGLDLTGLTGGTRQPDLHLDLPLLSLVLGGVALTVLTAVTVSAWLAGRTNLAQALRVGEDR